MKPILYFYISLLVVICLLIIYYLYKIMTTKPVYAIADLMTVLRELLNLVKI